MPSFRKILRAVTEISANWLTNGRTHGQSQLWAHRWWELQRSWRTNLTNGKTELDFFKLFDFYVFLTFSLVKFDSFGIIMFSKYETTRFHMVKNHHNLQYPSYSSTQNRKIGQKSKFWTFLRIIGHIFQYYAIQLGNLWMSNGL